ncbi:leucine rich adaptor protein 1-like [Mya arenaria]|nr:leucine rich adaptor protein 1-like [Mya arenaria]
MKGSTVSAVSTTDVIKDACALQMPKPDEQFSDAIDLSNACRQFYQTRKQATAEVKRRLTSSGRTRKAQTTFTKIDDAMDTLRQEMASLMELDLSLMKQLLTLNETVEDLKWQRKFYTHQSSLPSSSCDLSVPSDWLVSDTEIHESVFEDNRALPKLSSTPNCGVVTSSPRPDDIDVEFNFDAKNSASYREQDSFDSGIHEHTSSDSFP